MCRPPWVRRRIPTARQFSKSCTCRSRTATTNAVCLSRPLLPAAAPERTAGFFLRAAALVAHILRVNALGLCDVLCAADDGAAVGKDGEVVAADRGPHEILVARDLADRCELVGKLIERHGFASREAELD